MFLKKATKIDKIFTNDLLSKCQINGEDFVNFCGLLRKYELYFIMKIYVKIKEWLFETYFMKKRISTI